MKVDEKQVIARDAKDEGFDQLSLCFDTPGSRERFLTRRG